MIWLYTDQMDDEDFNLANLYAHKGTALGEITEFNNINRVRARQTAAARRRRGTGPVTPETGPRSEPGPRSAGPASSSSPLPALLVIYAVGLAILVLAGVGTIDTIREFLGR